MVNLFLTGRARSNVFNDVMELENDTGPALVLKGIDCRQNIGFLSLFEHYQSCQVGHVRWVMSGGSCRVGNVRSTVVFYDTRLITKIMLYLMIVAISCDFQVDVTFMFTVVVHCDVPCVKSSKTDKL